MNFINARKTIEDPEGKFENMRNQKFKLNLVTMLAVYCLDYTVVSTLYIFPPVEFVIGSGPSVRFAQPLYFPFDFASHSWIWYGLIHIYVIFVTHNSAFMTITTCLFLNTIMEHVCVEFRILGASYETIEVEKERADENFKNLVKDHQELLQFSLQ